MADENEIFRPNFAAFRPKSVSNAYGKVQDPFKNRVQGKDESRMERNAPLPKFVPDRVAEK